MYNFVMLVGNVGQDAEVSKVGDSTVAKFTLATKESWRDKSGNKKDATEWHHIEVWGKMAEAVGKWIEKGRELMVTGSIHTQSWEKDGIKKYKTIIRAKEIKFIGKKEESRGGSSREDSSRGQRRDSYTPDPDPGYAQGFLDDDIPF